MNRISRSSVWVVGGAVLLTSLPVFAQKLGLSSSFGDVTLHNMALGTAYPIRKIKGHGYKLTNLSEVPVELVVDVMPPLQGSVRPLYEEVPDTSWVKVSPRQFKLEPGASSDSEITIQVPADGQWKDRNFQAALYAHTLQGSFVNVGIYDKLLFSTGAGPEAHKAKGPRVEWVPAALKLRLKPGKTYASSSLPARLRLRNVGEAPRTITLAAAAFDEKSPAPKGYTAGDPAALTFTGGPVSLSGMQTADAAFELAFKPGSPGRKLAFRVRASSDDPALPEAYGSVLVEEPQATPVKAKKR